MRLDWDSCVNHRKRRLKIVWFVLTIFESTTMHLVYPSKFCVAIIFDFSCDDCNTLQNLETMVIQNSEGENKVHYGLCESSDHKRKRCKARRKIKLCDGQPSSQFSLELCRVAWMKTTRRANAMRAQEGPLKLTDTSLKCKESWRKLPLFGIQTGDLLAKPPFRFSLVAISF